ncbi:hypothetical protein HAX54_047171 [Datura stramonium]|uniref:Uncharacterized protein n=1 Tax=Datura stramonium TaxID=4076 RepID=A0ABS8SS72_DATST|nr:hypothetical protein [Datura stramonium]
MMCSRVVVSRGRDKGQMAAVSKRHPLSSLNERGASRTKKRSVSSSKEKAIPGIGEGETAHLVKSKGVKGKSHDEGEAEIVRTAFSVKNTEMQISCEGGKYGTQLRLREGGEIMRLEARSEETKSLKAERKSREKVACWSWCYPILWNYNLSNVSVVWDVDLLGLSFILFPKKIDTICGTYLWTGAGTISKKALVTGELTYLGAVLKWLGQPGKIDSGGKVVLDLLEVAE